MLAPCTITLSFLTILMPFNKKPVSRPFKHRSLSGSQVEFDGKRGTREAIDAKLAARNALEAAFTAPKQEASHAQVTIRRKRVMLPTREEEADSCPADADADKRSPRVFRLAKPVVPGEPEVNQDASQNTGSAPDEASRQDTLAPPPAAPLERIGHDRRARATRPLVVPPEPEGERASEAELLSRELALVNRILKLMGCANALRELQQRQLAAWAPLEASIERIGSRMDGLRHDRASSSFIPSASATSEMLSELGELAKQLDGMQRRADGMRAISSKWPIPKSGRR